MRFPLDTNILVYAAVSQNGPEHRATLEISLRASGLDGVIPLEALGERCPAF